MHSSYEVHRGSGGEGSEEEMGVHRGGKGREEIAERGKEQMKRLSSSGRKVEEGRVMKTHLRCIEKGEL